MSASNSQTSAKAVEEESPRTKAAIEKAVGELGKRNRVGQKPLLRRLSGNRVRLDLNAYAHII
jgi:hypothetical protein